MEIQFGTETEIGITRDQPEGLDVVAESIALVRSATAPGVRHCWDYSLENPHRDMRGFTVEELRQDTDESNYFALDAQRALTFHEIKSDLVLRNGARFYNDHAHPEYCTPECSTLLEILQQDFAGDTLLGACARSVNQSTENPLRLYKNNTDFLGHSYGCHENYLMPRRLAWETLSQGMVALFVTRQILCGSGKFGWEEEDRFLRPGFQISQRSDFFTEMQRRPLINTRDEPHANADAYRRFHVIIGDANMSLYSGYLKIGTTALVLQAMLNGAPLDRIPKVEDPLGTLKKISRDTSWKWECHLVDGRLTTGVEIQRQYLQLVKEFCRDESTDWLRVVTDWEQALNDLERDPLLLADRLDWAAKYRLIEQFREAEGLSPEDPWLQSLDLSYHLLDRQQGLFYGLLDQGSFRLPYALDEICHGRLTPPMSTRAAVRGYCIERFGVAVDLTQWDHVTLRSGEKRIELDLRNLFDP
ncbi:MAG: peptidase, partial [Verrucomicrobia bacterium]|nr:peptidase [Verrucomicrobiota bacterium]